MNLHSEIPQQTNIVDNEFRDFEDFTKEDQAEFMRDLFDNVFNNSRYEDGRDQFIKDKLATGNNDIRHYFLPNIPGGRGSITEIREGYDSRTEYNHTDERMFIRIGQGEMWILPKSRNPYFKVSMSECSTLVGETEDNLIVAHISFSEVDQFHKTLRFMIENGVDANTIQAIVSVGEYQASKNEVLLTPRIDNVDYYIQSGLNPANITPFEYFPGRSDENGMLLKNITQVYGNSQSLFAYTEDYNQRLNPYGFGVIQDLLPNTTTTQILK